MAKFICMNCGYRFDSQFEAEKRKCPYCAEAKVKKEQSAGRIVDESE